MISKFFNSKNLLKTKVASIVHDIEGEIRLCCDEKFWINHYGEYEIDPKLLTIWICVKTDKAKLNLSSNKELKIRITSLLIKHDYPEQARSSVYVGFESQETVDRESGGDWYLHFK